MTMCICCYCPVNTKHACRNASHCMCCLRRKYYLFEMNETCIQRMIGFLKGKKSKGSDETIFEQPSKRKKDGSVKQIRRRRCPASSCCISGDDVEIPMEELSATKLH